MGRRLIVDRVLVEGWAVAATAEATGVSRATVHRWLRRFREEGDAGLIDRTSCPHQRDGVVRRVPSCRHGVLRRDGRRDTTRQRLIVGPWSHVGMGGEATFVHDVDFGPEPVWGVDRYYEEQLRYFDRWLRDGAGVAEAMTHSRRR